MKKRPLCLLCLAFVVAVFISLNIVQRPAPSTESREGQTTVVTGQVYWKEYHTSVQGKQTLLFIKLSQSFSENASKKTSEKNPSLSTQNVICYLSPEQSEPPMGSLVELSGTLRNFESATNPGQFDMQAYYQCRQIACRLMDSRILRQSTSYSCLQEFLYQIKAKLSGVLDACFPQMEASVMKTILLGEKGQLDTEMKSLYQRNGIAHILAISGLHLSIIGMGLYRLLRRVYLPVPICAGCAMLVMYLYGTMTGMGTSCLRAFVMFALHMLAILLGRTYDLLTALMIAAVLILLEQPLYLEDSGFLFSFGAVLAMGLLLPVWQDGSPIKRPEGKKQPAYLIWTVFQTLSASLSVTLVTLPVSLSSYYQFPLYSLFLNLLVIPLMGLVMSGGMAVLLLGSLSITLGRYVGLIDTLTLMLYEKAGILCESLPFHNLILGKPAAWQIVCYLGLLLLLICCYRRLPLLLRYGVIAGAVLILTLPVRQGLSLTFLDVGQGDCIHIESETGRHYLIDGGSSTAYQVGKYRITPYLKSQGAACLEAVFVTHPDEDHVSGIEELFALLQEDGVQIGRLILPDIAAESKSEAYRRLEELAYQTAVPLQYLGTGDRLTDGSLQLTCLHPASNYASMDTNSYSMVLLLQYGEFSALFTGDVEKQGEQELVHTLRKNPSVCPVTVLKVAHHGSENSTSQDFLETIKPLMGVISCGAGNAYGHPHDKTLERLQEQDVRWKRTDESGAVTIGTDGKKMWISEYLTPAG